MSQNANAKRIGACFLLLASIGLSVDKLAGTLFSAGEKFSELARVREEMRDTKSHVAAVEAIIMNTRQNLDEKIDKLIRSVARIEGVLERK